MIPKNIIRKKTDFSILYNYYQNNDLDNLIRYIKSIYTNDKIIRTMKDFEVKIIDDTVLTEINSKFY